MEGRKGRGRIKGRERGGVGGGGPDLITIKTAGIIKQSQIIAANKY